MQQLDIFQQDFTAMQYALDKDIYSTVLKDSASKGETNDCVVKALSIAFRQPYDDVHEILEQFGRQPRRGTRYGTYSRAIKVLARRCKRTIRKVDRPRQPNGSRYTLKSLPRDYNRGRWIVVVSGHMLAMVDGEVLDWTAGRQHRVQSMMRVL